MLLLILGRVNCIAELKQFFNGLVFCGQRLFLDANSHLASLIRRARLHHHVVLLMLLLSLLRLELYLLHDELLLFVRFEQGLILILKELALFDKQRILGRLLF